MNFEEIKVSFSAFNYCSHLNNFNQVGMDIYSIFEIGIICSCSMSEPPVFSGPDKYKASEWNCFLTPLGMSATLYPCSHIRSTGALRVAVKVLCDYVLTGGLLNDKQAVRIERIKGRTADDFIKHGFAHHVAVYFCKWS